MSAIVKPRVPVIDLGEIVTGASTRGRTWIGAADCANYLRGHGRQLIPAMSPLSVVTSGSTFTYRFRAYTSAASRARVWVVMMASSNASTASGYVRVRAPASSGTSQYVSVGSAGTAQSSFFCEYVQLVSGADAEEELTIDLYVQSDDSIRILGISCTELPRSSLGLDATDYGTDINTCAAREPVIEEANNGILGAYDVLSNRGSGSRGGMFYWANDTTAPAPVTSAAYAAIPGLALASAGVPVLGRRLSSPTATSSNIHWRVYAKTDVNATTGDVRVTTSHGSDVISIGTGSHSAFAWYPATGGSPNSFAVDCEDYASVAGLQTAGTPAFDTLAFNAKSTGTLSIAAISVWENAT